MVYRNWSFLRSRSPSIELVEALGKAIDFHSQDKSPTARRQDFHTRVRNMYSWTNIAERTERVYLNHVISANHNALLKRGPRDSQRLDWVSFGASSKGNGYRTPFIERLRRFYGCGLYAGKLFCLVVAFEYLLYVLLEWLVPAEDIDIAPGRCIDMFIVVG